MTVAIIGIATGAICDICESSVRVLADGGSGMCVDVGSECALVTRTYTPVALLKDGGRGVCVCVCVCVVYTSSIKH